MTVASAAGRKLSSTRDVDMMFAEFEKGFEKDVKAEMARQNQRLNMHTRRREEVHQGLLKVAERELGKDKLKLASAEGFDQAPVVTMEDAPRSVTKRYRPVESHNLLIEWVKETMDFQVASGTTSFALVVAPTAEIFSGIGETLTPQMARETIVRAAYFYSLYLDDLATCYILVGDKDERNSVLNVLRDLRQHIEAEGHEWFVNC